jgi:hypothetical protein
LTERERERERTERERKVKRQLMLSGHSDLLHMCRGFEAKFEGVLEREQNAGETKVSVPHSSS